MLEWSRCAAATSDYVTRRHGFQAELCVEVYSFQTSQANEKQTWAFASLCGQQPSVFHFSFKGIFFSLLFFSWTSLRFIFVSFSLLLLKKKACPTSQTFFSLWTVTAYLLHLLMIATCVFVIISVHYLGLCVSASRGGQKFPLGLVQPVPGFQWLHGMPHGFVDY